jgi:group II intron reverse transcriptase/maturase
MRRLAVLSVRDRVIQQALNLALAPLWNGRFAPCSFAYRPGRSAIQAVAAVERGLTDGQHWVLDGDIASFFDSVPHSALFSLLDEWLPDPHVRRLLEGCVAATSPEGGRGVAQGSPLSPLLANLYLHRMDTTLLQAGYTLIRYADDFIVLCATRQQAEAALQTTERLLRHLALSLNPDKTRIVHRDEGFTFLGFTFTRDGKRPSEEGVESLRARLAAAADETTRRQILAGWHGYFATTVGAERNREGTEGKREATTEATERKREGTEGKGEGTEGAFGSMRLPSISVSSVVASTEGDEGHGDDTASGGEWGAPWWSEMRPERLAAASSEGSTTLTMYRERFVGRPEVFARYWRKDARKGYAPVRRPVTDEELSAHIAGTETLGTYLLHPDGTTQAMVLDVDGPQPTEAGQSAALQVVRRLVSTLQRHGVTPLWVDSGGKGYHLWLCFTQPTQAKAVRQWTARWLEQFRPYPEGVMVEVFPKQDHLSSEALGAVIRLPLGRHPETGRPSGLLTPEGQPVSDPWVALGQAPRVNAQAMLQVGPCERSALPEPPEAIGSVVRGCALLWGLVRKAAETHHLRHTERLALLYTLGHCGEAGRTYLHQVIALCSNYDPRITERQIQRLEDGHKPIRCGTLTEWLKDHLPGVTCPCVPKRANPSPLDLLRRAKKATPAGPSPTGSHPGWNEVAEDLFATTEGTEE